MDFHPGFLAGFVIGMQLANQIPQVLAGVKEIDNLHRAGKMLLGQVPDPLGPVGYDNYFLSAAPAAIPGFHIEPLTKLFSDFDSADVGGGTRIAEGMALLVGRGLGEDASQLGFPRMGRLTVDFAAMSSPMASCLAPTTENDAQELVYFARNFLAAPD